jgi:ribosome-associated translation inhibitor RaiA
MSIIFQYKNTTIVELSKNEHFNETELEEILNQCYQLEGFGKSGITDIYCVLEMTAHSQNSFVCEVILKMEGPDIRVSRDGTEPFAVAIMVCKKAVKVARNKSHKHDK